VAVLGALVAVAALSGAARPAQGTFPGRNGKLAFASTNHFCDRPCGRSHIFTVNPDGSHRGLLTRTRDARQPAWSPCGRQIAFSTGALLLMNADGSNVRKLASRASEPAFAPDGEHLAFRGDNGHGGFAVFAVKTNGKGKRRLVNNAEEPDWSPNGRKIAFVRPSTLEIYVIDLKSHRLRQLTHVGLSGAAFNPSWSPNGKKIAFFYSPTSEQPNDAVVVIKSSGGGRHVVGPRASGGKPAWSPSGKRIAYFKGNEDRGKANLVTINPDGSRLRKVTKVGYSDGVSWQRR
jgi:Tol biopolymer transport system component